MSHPPVGAHGLAETAESLSVPCRAVADTESHGLALVIATETQIAFSRHKAASN